jgi:quercetin dioxygenase-like cupin family protein
MSQISRRTLTAVLPAMLAAAGRANAAELLPSLLMNPGDATQRQSETTSQRRFFDGLTHENFRVEVHETTLVPGAAPHAAHRHVHEELIIIREGSLEVEMEGEARNVVHAGGLIFAASNRMHGWKNAGQSAASYFVVAIGGD